MDIVLFFCSVTISWISTVKGVAKTILVKLDDFRKEFSKLPVKLYNWLQRGQFYGYYQGPRCLFGDKLVYNNNDSNETCFM